MSSNTREYASYLRARAQQMGVKLPPIGKIPSKWPGFFRAPHGSPVKLSESPSQFTLALAKHAWLPFVLQTILRIIDGTATAFVPLVMAQMINGLVDEGMSGSTVGGFLLFLGLVAATAIAAACADVFDTAVWLNVGLTAARSVGHRVTKAGRKTKDSEAAGEIVTSLVSDSNRLGIAAIMVPNAVGSLVTITVAAVIMFNISVPLALVVAIGVPLSILIVTGLTRTLERRLSVRRDKMGALTVVATDAVVGLRVLRGIGGEDAYFGKYQDASKQVKQAGLDAAHSQALLSTFSVALPQIIAATIVGLGAYLTFAGRLSAGDFAAFFAYAWLVRNPVRMVADLTYNVAAASPGVKRMAAMWGITPPVDPVPAAPPPEWSVSSLHDQVSGVTIPAGRMTGISCADPKQAAALAQRLAGVGDTAGVRAGQVRLADLSRADIQSGIYLSETSAQVFSGSLQEVVEGGQAPLPRQRGVTELVYRESLEAVTTFEGALYESEDSRGGTRMDAALFAADAEDIVSGLSGGVTGTLTEKGRNLSGGQRQRLALARALYADPPILVLVQPTSAVDAHTEATISERLATLRQGKTTVVLTTSPLLLSHCDDVLKLGSDGVLSHRGAAAPEESAQDDRGATR